MTERYCVFKLNSLYLERVDTGDIFVYTSYRNAALKFKNFDDANDFAHRFKDSYEMNNLVCYEIIIREELM